MNLPGPSLGRLHTISILVWFIQNLMPTKTPHQPPEHWTEGKKRKKKKKKNKEYVDRKRIYLLLGRECEHGLFVTKLKKKERTFRDGERAKATCNKDILVVAIAWVKIVLHKPFVI